MSKKARASRWKNEGKKERKREREKYGENERKKKERQAIVVLECTSALRHNSLDKMCVLTDVSRFGQKHMLNALIVIVIWLYRLQADADDGWCFTLK